MGDVVFLGAIFSGFALCSNISDREDFSAECNLPTIMSHKLGVSSKLSGDSCVEAYLHGEKILLRPVIDNKGFVKDSEFFVSGDSREENQVEEEVLLKSFRPGVKGIQAIRKKGEFLNSYYVVTLLEKIDDLSRKLEKMDDLSKKVEELSCKLKGKDSPTEHGFLEKLLADCPYNEKLYKKVLENKAVLDSNLFTESMLIDFYDTHVSKCIASKDYIAFNGSGGNGTCQNRALRLLALHQEFGYRLVNGRAPNIVKIIFSLCYLQERYFVSYSDGALTGGFKIPRRVTWWEDVQNRKELEDLFEGLEMPFKKKKNLRKLYESMGVVIGAIDQCMAWQNGEVDEDFCLNVNFSVTNDHYDSLLRVFNTISQFDIGSKRVVFLLNFYSPSGFVFENGIVSSEQTLSQDYPYLCFEIPIFGIRAGADKDKIENVFKHPHKSQLAILSICRDIDNHVGYVNPKFQEVCDKKLFTQTKLVESLPNVSDIFLIDGFTTLTDSITESLFKNISGKKKIGVFHVYMSTLKYANEVQKWRNSLFETREFL